MSRENQIAAPGKLHGEKVLAQHNGFVEEFEVIHEQTYRRCIQRMHRNKNPTYRSMENSSKIIVVDSSVYNTVFAEQLSSKLSKHAVTRDEAPKCVRRIPA